MAQGFSLKDQLFNPETVGRLGDHFEKAGVFEAAPFTRDVLAQMGPLELKARINWIAEVLTVYLPDDFPAAADAILSALPPMLDPERSDDDFGHFIYAPLGVFVETHGIASYLDQSLDLLEEITQRFSMEFSIRAFLNTHEAATLERMQDWITHDSYHVRRLVSEGTRPKLPWGQGVGLTSSQTLPLLDQLHADKTRFVTRSVANHLNDISKNNANAVIERLSGWRETDAQTTRELDYMRKHALRGLIKGGHPAAMLHLGYRPDVDVTVTQLNIAPNPVCIDDTVAISFTVSVPKDAPLIVDYVIDFMKSNGKTAPKVFKCKQVNARANVPIKMNKNHKFKGDATTFRLYPGAHRIHVQVNGRIVQSLNFDLQ
jgi:3-methyladenine DNA glycosylase AlkC